MSICDECSAIGSHKRWCNRRHLVPTYAEVPVEREESAITECKQAELSDEEKAWQQQRKADQAELIAWILHYKNPADDETKLRQIKLVIE